MAVLHFERRFDPFFRPAWDALFREPSAAIIAMADRLARPDDRLALAQEKPLPGESECLDSIIIDMGTYMRMHWPPGNYQRAGNTKTHGIVRGDFIVHEDIPPARQGIFAGPARIGPTCVFRPRTGLARGHRRRRVHELHGQTHGRPGPKMSRTNGSRRTS